MAELIIQLENQTYTCEIKHSKRARYVRLKLSHTGILSVVVPAGVGMRTVREFVASQSSWIDRKLQNLTPTDSLLGKPVKLELIYLDERWDIEYLPDLLMQSVSVKAKGSSILQCIGQVDDISLVKKAIGQWLKKKAEQIIPYRLATLAEYHGFHFNRVVLRGQKTRWGSCSSQKNINLNYKLLFLEANLVDYVLIHELCHTVEMNHSGRFWALVSDCDADYKYHDKQLNRVAKTIPI